MQSNANSVDDYIAEATPERQPALRAIRSICRELLPGYDERMAYGMAAYFKGEKGEVAFANQKQTISVYVLKVEVLKAHKPLLAGLNVGKSCIRYPNPARIDLAVLRTLLSAVAASNEEPC